MSFTLKLLQKHKYNILLFAVIFLAAFLRLYRISDYMTFLGDEGRDLVEVKKILSGNLVFLGPRSSAADFYYGPIYFYFITPFLLLFNYDPVGPAVFIALLGIITVYLVYRIGKNFFGTQAGLIAASLYAVSPLVIAYSRSSWNPNPMPFVSLSLFYLAYRAIKEKSLKLFAVSGILLGIAIQLQYLAIFLGACLFIFTFLGLIIFKETRHLTNIIKSFVYQILGFIIGWSPFLAFELKHSFPNLKTIINFIFFGSPEKNYAPNMDFIENIKSVSFNIFARLLTRFPPPEQLKLIDSTNIHLWQAFTILLGILSVAAIFLTKDKLIKLLFSVWFFCSIFFFGFYKGQIHDYYLGFMFPLPFLMVGNLFANTLKNLKSYIKINNKVGLVFKLISFCILLILFLFNLEGNPFKNIPNRQKDQVKEIAEFVISKTENKPYNFALLTKGNSDHGYRYFLDILGKPPSIIQFEKADPERKTVTDQLLVVCEDPECQPIGNGLWEVAGFGRAEIVGEWQVSVVKIYKLKHYIE